MVEQLPQPPHDVAIFTSSSFVVEGNGGVFIEVARTYMNAPALVIERPM